MGFQCFGQVRLREPRMHMRRALQLQMAHAQVAQEDMDVSTPASRPRNVGDDVVHVVHGLQITEVRTS